MKESPATDVDRAALETMKKLGHGADGGDASRLAVRLADADPVRRGGGGVRGADAERSGRTSSRCRCRTRGPTCSARRDSSRRWTSCRPTGCGARWRWRWRASSAEVDLLLVPSLRDEMLTITNFTGHPSLTLRAGFVRGVGGAERLGARSGEPAAEVHSAAAGAARRHADRPAVRRGHARAGRDRAGAGVRSGRRAAGGILGSTKASESVRPPLPKWSATCQRSRDESLPTTPRGPHAQAAFPWSAGSRRRTCAFPRRLSARAALAPRRHASRIHQTPHALPRLRCPGRSQEDPHRDPRPAEHATTLGSAKTPVVGYFGGGLLLLNASITATPLPDPP